MEKIRKNLRGARTFNWSEFVVEMIYRDCLVIHARPRAERLNESLFCAGQK